jgi:hypothetical protein
MAAQGNSGWWLVAAGALSSAIHALVFDHYQGEYISTVRGEENFLQREILRFSPAPEGGGKTTSPAVSGPFVKLYLRYLLLQERFTIRKKHDRYEPALYRKENKTLIRVWSLLGPTTNRTALIICAFAGHPAWYLWGFSVIGNFLLMVLLYLQMLSYRRMSGVRN